SLWERGLGGEGETFQPSGFHVKLTPLDNALPVQSVAFFFQIGIKRKNIHSTSLLAITDGLFIYADLY
ncbi:hypothetical protein, partial [Tolypothrix sp. PCC 7601]|uniref:hypothetical protein n=1 Tax=Tolypothrix sp. PCC 7601 TaxID=1188 RepID=UPI0005EAA84D